MAERLASVTVDAPRWSTPPQAVGLAFRRSTLRRTVPIALLVGTILSLVNQAGVIAGGDATLVTWIRVLVNYCVPFCVSSAGFLTATKRAGVTGPNMMAHTAEQGDV